MRRLVEFFIRNSLVGNVLMLLILLFGYWGLKSMRSTFFPPAPLRFIKVQAVFPGASPEEMEEGVVLKIEENLQTVTGIERVTSVSSENSASVDVEVKRGYDLDIALQDVKNAVGQIPSFPVGMETPQIFKVENRNFAFSFALSGEVDLRTLKQFARQCEEELRREDFISKVTISGFPKEEIEIAFREADLRRYQLSLLEATQAIRSANIDVTGGKIKAEQDELLVRARNKGYFAEDLKNIPLKTSPEGSITYLYQVADVVDKWEDAPARSFMNGKPSVVVSVENTDDEDMLRIADFCKEYVEKFNQKNSIVKATIVRDGSIILRQRINLLADNGISGFFLVLAALTLFLNRQLAFWVASSIPISFAGLFIISSLMGLSINVISLFGMIVVVGILVDDGIVIGENIYSYYERGYERTEAAIRGTLEVLPSVVSAVMTTVVAFSAFFFLDGRIGDIFADLAAVVIITLLVSLVEGIFVLPGHLVHSKGMNRHSEEKKKDYVDGDDEKAAYQAQHESQHEAKPNLIDKIIDSVLRPISKAMDWLLKLMREYIYAPVLRFSLDRFQILLPLAFFLGALIISIGAVFTGKVKTTFFPFIERDDLEVVVTMPSGTREHITAERLDQIEAATWLVNNALKAKRTDGKDIVEKVEKIIGPASHRGMVKITLLSGDERQMSILDVSGQIREQSGEIVGAENVTFGSGSPFGKPISISVVGKNPKDLSAAVEQLKGEIKKIEGLKDIIDNNQEGLREVNIQLSNKGRQLGLNLQEILSQVRFGYFGSEVQRLQRGRDEVRVWVRLSEEDRSNLGQLENLRIRFADGREFPLHEIATLEVKRGLIAINHISGEREVKVEADIGDRRVSVVEITNNIRNNIVPKLNAEFPEVKFLFEGQNKENEKTMRSMGIVMPIIGLVMAVIILLTFQSISQTLAVIITIPFGLIGVIWGHAQLGAPISFFSGLGMVALLGIMVNDSLVLVGALNERLKEGEPFLPALIEASVSRFRAIFLTSVTTILGLAPLIVEKSFQAQFLIPMAISIAFGLFIATIITLLLLPVLLLLFNYAKRVIFYTWFGYLPADSGELENAHPQAQNQRLLYLAVLVVAYFGLGLLLSLSR